MIAAICNCLKLLSQYVNSSRNYCERVGNAQECKSVIRAVFGEQLSLISQLDEDEKNALVKIINSMLTKKRMKDLLDGKINLNQ